jgi:hypothetical protein
MARKSEQQLTLEEQHRLWMGKLRKARTLQQQATIAKILKDIEVRLWPNPVDEAVAVAKAAKLQMKAGKAAVAQAKKAEAAELERLKEIERQKVRDEENPVMDHVKRAIIRAEMREEAPMASAHVSDTAPSTEATVPVPSDANTQEAITAPETVAQSVDGVVVTPELTTITLEAEASAKRQSSIKRDDGLLDFLKRATQPLESRDEVVIAPPRRYVPEILTESSGPGETFARLGGYNTAPEPAEPVESGYLAEWDWTPPPFKRG